MATNILAMPLVQAVTTTGTNEDWIDSLQYLQDDEVTPMDISGIEFAMEMRRTVGDSDVLLSANTANGKVTSGGTGNSFLSWYVPYTEMEKIAAGEYTADIIARADGYQRAVAQLTITLFQGVTRWPLSS